eukprot:scaffold1955_cov254-Pinguiococcus_pyrenoidosus.AAC.9
MKPKGDLRSYCLKCCTFAAARDTVLPRDPSLRHRAPESAEVLRSSRLSETAPAHARLFAPSPVLSRARSPRARGCKTGAAWLHPRFRGARCCPPDAHCAFRRQNAV